MNVWNSDFAFWAMFFATVASALGIAVVLNRTGISKKAEAIREQLKLSSDLPAIPAIADPNVASFTSTLLKELCIRGNTSLLVVSEFTQYHYIAILSAVLSGAFGGVATFLVTSFGWDSANQSLKGFFVACAASLPFWLAMIQVFRYSETIAKHESIYAACSNIVADVQRVVLCPPATGSNGQPFDLKDYMNAIAAKCEAVRAIGISFDGSKISLGGIELPK